MQPVFTVSVGFFKRTSLRIQLSFVMLLTLLMVLLTSTFNTAKTVINCCENKVVGIVIYVFLCLSYKQL